MNTSQVNDPLIRAITPADAKVWEALRCAHWPDGAADHGPEIAAFFAGTIDEPNEVFVAETGAAGIVGFVELSIRQDIPGLEGVRTGYVEGLYIKPEFRGKGTTRRFLRTAQDWSRQENCPSFASDRAGRVVIDRGFNNSGT